MKNPVYHHGDLRTAVLDAAEAALQDDPNALPSVRAIAAQLGVSPTAPLAHFKTKADLVVALAARGFEQLHALTEAYGRKHRDPERKLEALAEAYLEYGFAKPGLYRIMFNTGVEIEEHPEVFAASRTAYGELQSAIRELFPDLETGDQDNLALGAWGLVHGLTALRSEGRIPDDIVDDQSPKFLAKTAAGIFFGNT